jgi:hypothetical protein
LEEYHNDFFNIDYNTDSDFSKLFGLGVPPLLYESLDVFYKYTVFYIIQKILSDYNHTFVKYNTIEGYQYIAQIIDEIIRSYISVYINNAIINNFKEKLHEKQNKYIFELLSKREVAIDLTNSKIFFNYKYSLNENN